MTNLYDIISAYVPLRKTANTNGGELHGACPFCGGRDRFAVWPNADKPGWWCRQCGKHGDAIQFLREHVGLSFAEACAQVGRQLDAPKAAAPQPAVAPDPCEPPSEAWRAAGAAFVFWAQNQLTAANQDALDYVHNRGLTDKTIRTAGLGYNPAGRWSERAKWGLEPDKDGNDRLWLPAGIVIPQYADGALWKIEIRQDKATDADRRYKTVTGSANVLAGADSIQAGKPAILVEGPIDWLAVAQAAGDLLGVGRVGTTGAHRVRWLAQLALCSEVLVSLDADAAGDAGAAYWLDALPNARRWRPYYADPAQMLQDGQDVRGWVLAGLGKAPRVARFHAEFVSFWAWIVQERKTPEYLAMLAERCRRQGADYDVTVAWLMEQESRP